MATHDDSVIAKGQSIIEKDLEWLKGHHREAYHELLEGLIPDKEIRDIVIDNADKMAHRFYAQVTVQGMPEGGDRPHDMRKFDVTNMSIKKMVDRLDEFCDQGEELDSSGEFWDRVAEAFGQTHVANKRTPDPRRGEITHVRVRLVFTKGVK